jgi:hypothetical protein
MLDRLIPPSYIETETCLYPGTIWQDPQHGKDPIHGQDSKSQTPTARLY